MRRIVGCEASPVLAGLPLAYRLVRYQPRRRHPLRLFWWGAGVSAAGWGMVIWMVVR